MRRLVIFLLPGASRGKTVVGRLSASRYNPSKVAPGGFHSRTRVSLVTSLPFAIAQHPHPRESERRLLPLPPLPAAEVERGVRPGVGGAAGRPGGPPCGSRPSLPPSCFPPKGRGGGQGGGPISRALNTCSCWEHCPEGVHRRLGFGTHARVCESVCVLARVFPLSLT